MGSHGAAGASQNAGVLVVLVIIIIIIIIIIINIIIIIIVIVVVIIIIIIIIIIVIIVIIHSKRDYAHKFFVEIFPSDRLFSDNAIFDKLFQKLTEYGLRCF